MTTGSPGSWSRWPIAADADRQLAPQLEPPCPTARHFVRESAEAANTAPESAPNDVLETQPESFQTPTTTARPPRCEPLAERLDSVSPPSAADRNAHLRHRTPTRSKTPTRTPPIRSAVATRPLCEAVRPHARDDRCRVDESKNKSPTRRPLEHRRGE